MRQQLRPNESAPPLPAAATSACRPHPPVLSAKVIHIDDPHRHERRRVEAFVEAAYRRAYGGRIARHYPTLMSVQDVEGRIYAVVGLRLAGQSDLFLEQYLDAPVEVAIAQAWDARRACRDRIAEIGNLASNGRRATIVLFLALAAHLRALGCDVAVATATRTLRGIFAKAGFATVELGCADAARLPDGGAAWGSYYETDPVVLAGSIGECRKSLESFDARTRSARPLRSRLHFAGPEA